MFLKKIKKIFILSILTLFSIPNSILAYSDYILIGGQNIGIELQAKGIMIVGLYKVNDIYPARDSGLEVGDIIISINDNSITSIEEMVDKIDKIENKENIKIKFLRFGKEFTANLKLYKDNNGVYKTGLYVKDSITGLGTLTYVDPNTKLFGALGHPKHFLRSCL